MMEKIDRQVQCGKKINNLDDEKNIVWYKILKDPNNNFDGYAFRLTKDNDYKFPRYQRTKYSDFGKQIFMRNFIDSFNSVCVNFSVSLSALTVFPLCQINWLQNGDLPGENEIRSCSENYYLDCPELIFNERDNCFYTITPNPKIKTERVGYNKKLNKLLHHRVIKVINIYEVSNYLYEKYISEKNPEVNFDGPTPAQVDIFSPEIIEIFGISDNGSYLDRIKDEISEYMKCQFSIASIIKDKGITVSGSGPLEYYPINNSTTSAFDVNGEIIIYISNFFTETKKNLISK